MKSRDDSFNEWYCEECPEKFMSKPELKAHVCVNKKLEKTETTERFEDKLKDFWNKIQNTNVKHLDAMAMYLLSENLLLRYEEVRKSRDNWKNKYQKLKEENKKDPRTMTNCDPAKEKKVL